MHQKQVYNLHNKQHQIFVHISGVDMHQFLMYTVLVRRGKQDDAEPDKGRTCEQSQRERKQ